MGNNTIPTVKIIIILIIISQTAITEAALTILPQTQIIGNNKTNNTLLINIMRLNNNNLLNSFNSNILTIMYNEGYHKLLMLIVLMNF